MTKSGGALTEHPRPRRDFRSGHTNTGGTMTRIQSNYTETITGPPLSAADAPDADEASTVAKRRTIGMRA